MRYGSNTDMACEIAAIDAKAAAIPFHFDCFFAVAATSILKPFSSVHMIMLPGIFSGTLAKADLDQQKQEANEQAHKTPVRTLFKVSIS